MAPVPQTSFVSDRFHFMLLAMVVFVDAQLVFSQQPVVVAQPSIHPNEVMFRRQAARRLVFDKEHAIPLSVFKPSKVVSLDLMHPELSHSKQKANGSLDGHTLKVFSSGEEAWSFRWVGGFNPFATYDVTLKSFIGTGACGMSFRDAE